ncbi:OmpA family protein [Tenacibaculum retecalamus]|uniref:OmpA family protein n=1 Tax=Tenacibaculum retecalamus TaxID=3018315 RepID=UPI0023D8F0E4|nr:OmpA family protein [Tenacibaculum retecalamus]WBX70798.1 OmpA family protein [Tenacibaculum retecalamus]
MKIKIILLLIVFINATVYSQKNNTYKIFFDSNESDIDSVQIKRIDSIKDKYSSKKVVLNLVGYTDELGSNNYNLILSKKRVNAVKKLFKGYRILKSKAGGELKGVTYNNRKVLIEVIQGIDEKRINNFTKLRLGDELVLKNVLFLPGTDSFEKSSTKSLAELYLFLIEKSKIKIKITGHICCPKTDNPKEDAYNSLTGKRNLSEARAKKVFNYLIDKGIRKSRLYYKGMAYRKPLGKEDKYNRRVEVQIIR